MFFSSFLLLVYFEFSLGLDSLIATPFVQSFTSHPGYGTTDYPEANYSKEWYITTNWINHTIEIDFVACAIENAKTVCLFDYLYIFDGADANGTELLKTCCVTLPHLMYRSTGGEMYLKFETDGSIAAAGFEIKYVSYGITTTTTTTTEAPPTTERTTYLASSSVERTSSDASTSAAERTTTDANSSAAERTTTDASSSAELSTVTSAGVYISTSPIDYTSTVMATSKNTASSKSTGTSSNTNKDISTAFSDSSTYSALSTSFPKSTTTSTVSTEDMSSTDINSIDISENTDASADTTILKFVTSSSTESSVILNKNTTNSQNSINDNEKDNTLYIIIACIVTLVLLILIIILIVVMCMKKNKRTTYPKPFLVHEEKGEQKKTKFVNQKLELPVPTAPPLNTVMPETNLFDLDLPDTGRGNLLPPLYSSTTLQNNTGNDQFVTK